MGKVYTPHWPAYKDREVQALAEGQQPKDTYQEGDHPAMKEQAGLTWTVQQTQVPLLIVAQGIGYPPKTFAGSDTDDDLPPHIPDIEDYCRTCLTKKVRCTCKPMSDWSVELNDITQPDPPDPNNNTTNDRDDEQDQALPSELEWPGQCLVG